MDTDQLKSMLVDYGRELSGIPLEGPPTRGCLPMPLIEAMAADSHAGTADERAHVRSCGFCSGMLERVRVEANTRGVEDEHFDREVVYAPPTGRSAWWLSRWSAVSGAAACLVLGIGLGRILPGQQPRPVMPEPGSSEPSVVTGWPERAAGTSHPTEPADEQARVREAAQAFLERGVGPRAPATTALEDRYENLLKWKAEAEKHLRNLVDVSPEVLKEQTPAHEPGRP